MDTTPFCSGGSSICQLHIQANRHVRVALNVVELIELAIPGSTPLAELARNELRGALRAIDDALAVEAQITRLLSSPFTLDARVRR
jgi:hypothetical protein